MRLLDLFCGAGGGAMGYRNAGIEDITGIDIAPQPRYPFRFIQGDAIDFLEKHGHEYDLIHVSPPCQFYSRATPLHRRGDHPDLISDVRKLLNLIGKPYIIENVEGAKCHLKNPIKLCGTMLGLPIWRHRYFEIRPEIFVLTPPCNHYRGVVQIDGVEMIAPVLCTGGGDGKRSNRKTHRPRGKVRDIRLAMGIPWMVQAELTEAIPPAYTEWIARHFLQVLQTPERSN